MSGQKLLTRLTTHAKKNTNVKTCLRTKKMKKTDDIGFAKVDTDRLQRRGMPEVIFAPGKTSEQIAGIMQSLLNAGQNVFATRISEEQYADIKKEFPDIVYHKTAKAITLDITTLPQPTGLVSVVCAGTSDLPVAEEAALTAERLGAKIERIYDAGVAGIHRIMPHLETLRKSRAVIVVAGMEGALPSVVGGLIDRPIIAVPTSIGYGINENGKTALHAMLCSCVPGISVVNIDNGFGAGVCAAMINRK